MATSSKSAKPAAKGAEAAEAPKKSKKMLIIVILLVVLLLIVAGGAAAFVMLSGKKGPAEGEHGSEKAEASSAPVFVNIEPYVVNLQQETGDQFLQASITLQVGNEATAEAIKAFMPLVRSRLLLVLSSKKASELQTTEGKKKLTEDIIASLNQPFTPNGKPQQVNDVFYTSFVIQQQ